MDNIIVFGKVLTRSSLVSSEDFFYCPLPRDLSRNVTPRLWVFVILQCTIGRDKVLWVRWLPLMLMVARLQDQIPAVAEQHLFILCMRRSGGTADEGGECDQSIGSTVSDSIVRIWLWSTATRSSPLGYFSKLLQVVDNWPHILW